VCIYRLPACIYSVKSGGYAERVNLMKRSAMPARTAPLPRGQGLARGQLKARTSPREGSPGVPMRQSSLTTVHPQVTPDERRARAVVKERSGGWCELGCGRPAQSWSHRVARSQGGPWSPVNGLGLCSLGSGDPGCHTWTGRWITLACAGGWRLRSWQDPAAEPVWLAPACPPLPAGWYLLLPDGGLDAVTLDRPRPVMPWEAP
jgi:hypothetical protein